MAQRAHTAQHVAGGTLDDIRCGHHGLFSASGFGDLLQPQLAIHGDDTNGQLLAIQANDEGFEHLLGRHAKFVRRFQPIGRGGGIVLILMELKRNTCMPCAVNRRCHGVLLS